MSSVGQVKPSSKRRRLAGILAVAGVTAACSASSPAAWPPAPHHPPEVACTNLPAASPRAAGTSGQRSPLDMPSVPGGLLDIAARSPSSAWAVGSAVPTPAHSRALVAHWNGAVWRTVRSRALPPESALGAVALFPGGAWAVGEKGMAEYGRVFHPLIVRVTGTTVRQVPVPVRSSSSALGGVAATSAADAWAVGATFTIPLILHWNGTAWTRARLPATVGRGFFTGVAATSAANAWAVMTPSTRGRARIVHWNGRRWGDVVSPAIGMSYDLRGVAATSAENAWAVGTTGTRAVILHWNGRRWTCALSPKINNFPHLNAVSASSADNAWAVGGYDTAILALHWNGHEWKQVMTPEPGQVNLLEGVAVIPQSGHAWAVGGTDHRTLMLYWNGTAWH